MKIKSSILIKTSFAFVFSISIYETYLKISHIYIPHLLLAIGGIATLVFILIALDEIFRSTRINKPEKIMWTICIILLSPISGFVYLLTGRKRIIPIFQ
jgi:hypothetical protein